MQGRKACLFVTESTTYLYLSRLTACGLKVIYYLFNYMYVARFTLVVCYSILILHEIIFCCLQLRLTRNAL